MTLLKSVFIPQDSVNDLEVKVVICKFPHGAKIKKGQTILEYETSKSVISIESDEDGYVGYKCEVNQIVKVGSEVAGVFEKWDENLVEAWRCNGNNVEKDELAPVKVTLDLSTGTGLTQYSFKAEQMIIEFGLSKNLFNRLDFVSADDVRNVLNKNSATSRSFSNVVVSTEPDRVSGNPSGQRLVVVCANDISNDMICDIVNSQNIFNIIGYVVDDEYKSSSPGPLLATDVFQFPEKIDRSTYDAVVLAMGGSPRSMKFRRKVFEHYSKYNVPFVNLVSSSANIASNVSLGKGNVIESNVYIGPGAVIGDNNFISYSTTIGHHNVIGDCNLFAPGVMMAGLVKIGNDCILPTGVNFIDRVSIGNRVILPVGYNVIADISDDKLIKMRDSAL